MCNGVHKRLILTVCLGACLLGAGRWLAARPDRAAAQPTWVTVPTSGPVLLSAGSTTQATVRVIVEDGYHLQANPASHTYLIPTRLDLEHAEGLEIGQPLYPTGTPYRLEGSTDTLSVYDGAFDLRVPVRTTASTRLGNHVLRGSLTYQRCDHRTCFPPASTPLALAIHVLGTKEEAPRSLRLEP